MSDPEPEIADAELGVERKRWPLWKIVAVVVVLSAVPCVLLTVLLASIVMPRVLLDLSEAQQSKAKADIMAISAAVEVYVIENNGRYPESLGLVEISDALDPWGNPYVYEPPPSGSPDFRVLTYGADGQPGGEGPKRDISNVMIRDGEF